MKCPRHIILAIPFFLAACAPDDYRDDSFLHDPFRVKTVMQETLKPAPLMPPLKNRRRPGAKHKAAICRRYP